MDRALIEDEFHSLLDEVVNGVRDKLDIESAVRRRSSSRTAGKIAENSDMLQNKIVEPEIKMYRRRLKKQFSIILDSVEEGKDIREVEKEILRNDIFYQNMSPKSDDVRGKVLDRFDGLQEAVEKIHESEADEVWEGVGESFSEEEAREFIEQMFGFMEELEDHEHRLNYVKNVKISDLGLFIPLEIEVDYTPEAIEVMKESEEEVRQKMNKKIDRIYS